MTEKPSSEARKRIIGFDVARALAVFGMVAVNFRLAISPDAAEPAWLRAAIGSLEGRAAATFVVLAGVGLALMTRRSRMSGDREARRRDRIAVLKRALFLFVVGWLYTPIWPADILHFYGVYLAIAAFVLFVSGRRLLLLAAAAIALFPILLLRFDYERGWDWETLHYDGLYTAAGAVRHMVWNGFHPVVPWVAFVLVGLFIGRLDLTRATVRRRLLVTGVALAGAAEIVSRGLIRLGRDAEETELLGAFFGTEMMPPSPLYMMVGIGVASAIISISVGIGLRFPDVPWSRPLVATGQLALTLYVAHVVVGLGILEALGRLHDQSLPFAAIAILVFCVTGVVFATLWRQRFDRGPLEALMRKVTG